MESLQVRTGQISLQILDDEGNERGIFKFNPEDINCAKAIINLQAELNDKEAEFTERATKAETDEEKVMVLDELTNYFNNAIDECFGSGSSKVLFGNAKTLSMYQDFFEGIIPYYEKASKKRLAKYNKKKSGK